MNWFQSLLSNSDDASHKRFISVASWVILVVMVILYAFECKVSDTLIYVFAALAFGQSSLTVIDKFLKK